MAGRGVRGRPAAGPGGPEHAPTATSSPRSPASARAAGRTAPVPVPQGQPAVDPVHRERPVQGRSTTAGCGCRRSATCRCAGRGTCRRDPRSVTVIKDAAGRYFASFVVQTTPTSRCRELDSEVGIDLGLTHFAVLSDGTKVAAPKFLRRAARKLKRLQQDLSRKQTGSNNRKKAVVKVARAHARVGRHPAGLAAQALHGDHPRQPSGVRRGPVRGRSRPDPARQVRARRGLGRLHRHAGVQGRPVRAHLRRVDRFFPSTRMCSDCGRINDKMALNVRSWTCPCGSAHDRDVNAAINMIAAGRAESLNDRGAQVRPAPVPAPRREAVIHPDAACSTRSVEGISVLLAERSSSPGVVDPGL